MGTNQIKVGVKDLLEVFYHPKDLGTSPAPSTRGLEGTQGHRLIAAQRPPGYRAEVPVTFEYDWHDYHLSVSGRMDGLEENESGLIVEEVKTTYLPLANISPGQYPLHEAQLQLYLYFLMIQNPDKDVSGRLTYLNMDDLSERSFPVIISLATGANFFSSLAEGYLIAVQNRDHWRQIRNDSLLRLSFPFPEERSGQKDLMEIVAQAIEQERDLFAEAATGTGKTIAVLFPVLKQLATSDRFSQIFFLTAKTAGKEILKKTLQTAQSQGLHLRTIFIEAKERVCPRALSRCQPLDCPYAFDYYYKVKQIIPDLLVQELLTPELVQNQAIAGTVCPFELSLDLALQADLIVADYNYVFDPGVYLRRFFAANRRDYVFLVDEAHNLVNRGREMYSGQLSRRELEELSAIVARDYPKVADYAEVVIDFFKSWQAEIREEGHTGLKLNQLPEMVEPALERLVAGLEFCLRQSPPESLKERLLEFYFKIASFTRIVPLALREYTIYVKLEPGGPVLHLFCLNPGPSLRQRLDHGRVAIFFSATLSPFRFFQELLGGTTDSLSIQVSSPFPKETRLYLHIPGIDTRYQARESSVAGLVQSVEDLVTAHTGNYLVFFPSYAYLQMVLPQIKLALRERVSVYTQFPSMNDRQKQEFLKKVSATGSNRSNLGLAISGGLFGEGVDLPGEELVGVLIVGPGLPVISDEQELIRSYFDERNGQGYLFAYLIPGLIRVIQSAGRVFRTLEDRGVVVLVDDRFLDERYQELLPPDWFLPGRSFSRPDYQEALREFWDENSATKKN